MTAALSMNGAAQAGPSPRSALPSVRALLLGLLLVCLVPGVVAVCVLTYSKYHNGRIQIEKDTILTARALAQAVDGQLSKAQVIALALSTSNVLLASDLPGFHRRARELIQIEGIGVDVVLSNASGQQVVNTSIPFGEPLPRHGNAGQVKRVFESGEPVVSDVFIGGATGIPRASVEVPVVIDGKVTYTLGVNISPQQFGEILSQQNFPANWISSIFDSTGTVAARSNLPELFVGKPVNPEIVRRLPTQAEAAFESVTKEGVPAMIVFSRSPQTRWAVAIAIPLATLQADLRRNFLFLSIGSLLLFAASAALARRLSIRITDSVRSLTDSAKALAGGDEVRVSYAGFRESEEAGRAMVDTAQMLIQRTQALSALDATLLGREAELAEAQRIAHIGSWYWEASTGTTSYSDETRRIFGRETLPPLAEQANVLYPLEAWQRLKTAVQAALETGTAFELELPALVAGGTQTWLGVRGETVRSADGSIIGLRGTVQDITERRRAEADARRISAIEAENRQIQEANRLKGQFLANMSHELRTPLNAIIGFADLLQSGIVKPESPKHQEFLGHICTSGRHLLQLINDVLDLSKVESGKFEFFAEPVDLAVVLKEVHDVLHTTAHQKDITISMHLEADFTDLTLDPARLKQVLYNYLSNAIKFTAPGGQVTVRALHEGPEHFRVEVEDTGIGIDADDLPRLFKDFEQLDAGRSKQHQGTGLGLALTRRLVEAQGGQVGVRSTAGKGSVFYVVLNRTHGLDNQRADAALRGALQPEGKRVLVIEGDLRDRAMLVETLSQAGFQVDAATDGPHALRRAQEHPYAALTIDLNLPGQRGLELLDGIRSRGASRASPVIGVTIEAGLHRSAAFAVANVLSKPIRNHELSAAMARITLAGERRAQVMVIDDEPLSLEVMRVNLKSLGIDAVCFEDGRVALQEIDRHRPEAIVLDLMMPAFDGFQVLDALQRLPAWRDVPVFIWTSMLLTDEEYAMLARSASAILIKGGGAMDVLLESLRRWRQPLTVPAQEKL